MPLCRETRTKGHSAPQARQLTPAEPVRASEGASITRSGLDSNQICQAVRSPNPLSDEPVQMFSKNRVTMIVESFFCVYATGMDVLQIFCR
jgi:hypothetical protein